MEMNHSNMTTSNLREKGEQGPREKSEESSPPGFDAGQMVMHPLYGIGVVEKI